MIPRSMANKMLLIFILLGLFIPACTGYDSGIESSEASGQTAVPASTSVVPLPAPRLAGDVSLEESIAQRRSVRDYSSAALKLEEVSQLLWAGQGITGDAGGRAAPSAGALYPLELYLVAGNVENLTPGVYHYRPQGHEIALITSQDARESLAGASLGQSSVKDGAVSIVIAAVYERTTGKYGERGVMYVHLEAGHAAQNICLQATVLGLGSVTIGAFDDNRVKGVLSLPDNEAPLYVIPIGSLN